MSNRERILQLVNNIPDSKLAYVVSMLETLQGYAGEAVEPDEWDLAMIAEAEEVNGEDPISLEDLKKELKLDV